MSRGKYLSLEEARKSGKLKQFAKEHPSEGDGEVFGRLLDAMVKPKSSPKEDRTSNEATSAGYTGTRTRRGTSEDASG